jgi:hypothetical protein
MSKKSNNKTTETTATKTPFIQLMKEMRLEIHPMFKALSSTDDPTNASLTKIEELQETMAKKAGYTMDEFTAAMNEHFMDFTNEDPEQWVIRHDPENAKILTPIKS